MSNTKNKSDDDSLLDFKFRASDDEILDSIRQIEVTEEAESVRDSIYGMIQVRLGFEEEKKKVPFLNGYKWFIAASVVFMITLGMGYIQYKAGLSSAVPYLEARSDNHTIMELTLPDSTRVILNGGSTLRYPSAFSGNERVVILNGEAWFDVSEDKEKPFIINTPGMDVKVLGTQFNLKSFGADHLVTLTLEEGVVVANTTDSKNREIRLGPGEQVILNKATGKMSSQFVDTRLYTFWMNGELYFDDNTLEEIVQVLENKFSMEIIIADDRIKNEIYYCQFRAHDELERILHLLSIRSSWKYEIKGNQVLIYNE